MQRGLAGRVALVTGVSRRIGIRAAIDALTLILGADLARRGITVNVRQDAARLAAFLASDDAAWITGQILRSRGGL